MKASMITLLAAALAGCASAPEVRPVQATVTGPVFPASRFTCAVEPRAPDPDTVGNKAGSAGARYQNALRYSGQDCRSKLRSVGAELDAAGQVIRGGQ